MTGDDTVGIGPEDLIGLPIRIPSLWTVARTEVSRPAAEVRPHAHLISRIENIDQPVESGKRLFPQFLSQLTFDGSNRFALYLEILAPQGGEGHGLFSSTGWRIVD